jgi:hypothetical protein
VRTTLVEMSEMECQVKPGQLLHVNDDTQRSEITTVYSKEMRKRESRMIKILVRNLKPLKLLGIGRLDTRYGQLSL